MRSTGNKSKEIRDGNKGRKGRILTTHPLTASAFLFLGVTTLGHTADWTATVEQATGILRSRAAGSEEWKAAAKGQHLDDGDTILTLDAARAQLLFADGTRASLGPHTELRLGGERVHARSLSLLRGWAHLVVAKVSGESGLQGLTVTTPTAVAAVKGTDFSLAVSDEVTDIAVAEGAVLCSDRARRYQVLMRAGEAARWDRNGLWQPVRRLSDDERAALGSDEPARAPDGLRFGGDITANYQTLKNGVGFSNPWLGLSPLNPAESNRRQTRSTFSNPWMSLEAESPLGPRAHTFWELWLTKAAWNQWPGTEQLPGRVEIFQAWAEAELASADHGPAPLILRAGVMPVPVGLLNQDPALPRRTFASYPIYAVEIVPVPWQDVGAQLTGGVAFGNSALRYQVAAINGLQLEPNDSWQAPLIQSGGLWWAKPTELERTFGRDNNGNKAVAGRLGYRCCSGFGLGVSGYSGKADMTGTTGLMIAAADLSLGGRLAGVDMSLRAEGGRAAMTGTAVYGNLPSVGGYAELELTPAGWPVTLGLGASRVAVKTLSGDRIDEPYAALAWRFDPRLTFKLQGESYQGSSGGKPAQALIAQVAAFW